MEKKVILSIGLNDKDLHTQVITEEKALETIVATLHKNNIIGATLKVGNIGVYMGEVEKSIEAILYNVELENVKKSLRRFKNRTKPREHSSWSGKKCKCNVYIIKGDFIWKMWI